MQHFPTRGKGYGQGLCNREVIPGNNSSGCGDSVTMSMSRQMIYRARFQVCDKMRPAVMAHFYMIYNIRLVVVEQPQQQQENCIVYSSTLSLLLHLAVVVGKKSYVKKVVQN